MTDPLPFRAAAVFRARRRMAARDFRGAVDDLRAALSADPDDAVAHALLAQALLHLKRVGPAKVEAGRALAGDPNLASAHAAMAQAAFLEGDLRGAEQAGKKAAALAPTDAGIRRFLASTALARDRLVAASSWAVEAEELDPGVESRIVSARVALRSDADAALRLAEEAVALDPESAGAFAIRAAAELALGRAEDARFSALEALRLDPDDAEALDLLVRAKIRKNPIAGPWMRFAIWVARGSRIRFCLIFIGLLVLYRFITETLSHFGYAEASLAVTVAYLVLLGVSWWSSIWLRNTVAKERAAAQLGPDY